MKSNNKDNMKNDNKDIENIKWKIRNIKYKMNIKKIWKYKMKSKKW